MPVFNDFLSILSQHIYSMHIHNMGVGGKGTGVGTGRWWQQLKQRSQMTQMAGFRVAMMSTCTHNGPFISIPLYKV